MRRLLAVPYRLGMRIGRLVIVAAAAAVLVALAGCTPGSPQASATPSASATPVFASDAEALAAAEKAYAAYQAAVDKSLQKVDDSGLNTVAAGEALKNAKASVRSFASAKRYQVGASKVLSVTAADLAALTTPGGSSEPAQIYACLDLEDVDVLNAAGDSVSETGRQTLFPTVVDMRWSQSLGRLLVSDESVWDGDNFCT